MLTSRLLRLRWLAGWGWRVKGSCTLAATWRPVTASASPSGRRTAEVVHEQLLDRGIPFGLPDPDTVR